MNFLKNKKIKFIGSGKWAFQVLKELSKNFKLNKIFWDCRYDIANNKLKIKEFDLNNVFVINNTSDEKKNYDYIFIISNSLNHIKDFIHHQSFSLPIFLEKPLFPDIKKFKMLNEFQMNNTCLNLEFYYAFYINKLKKYLKEKSIFQLDYIWFDPFRTDKIEYIKNSEICTSIFQDQLLHILSINKSIGFDSKELKLNEGNTFYENNLSHSLNISCVSSSVDINLSISRFAEQRERKLIVNKGEIILDFTSDPFLTINGKPPIKLKIDSHMMPISETIRSFFYHQEVSLSKSPLSISSLIPEIEFCLFCEDKFISNIDKILDSFQISQKISTSVYAYYLGIKYYRKTIEDKNMISSQYLNGEEGLAELIKWGDSSRNL